MISSPSIRRAGQRTGQRGLHGRLAQGVLF